MRDERLTILLHVVRDSRPAARDFEIAPTLARQRFGNRCRRLPAPKSVEANAFSRAGRFVERLGDVPIHVDAIGQLGGEVITVSDTCTKRYPEQRAEDPQKV